MQANAPRRPRASRRWVVVALAAALAVPLQGARAPEQDPIVGGIAEGQSTPCSCDCCEVAEATADEKVVTDAGHELKFRCNAPATNNEACGSTCTAANGDGDIHLTSSQGAVDYGRYCTQFCRPGAQQIGTACVRLTSAEMEALTSSDGNGKEVFYSPQSTVSWGGTQKKTESAENTTMTEGEAEAAEARQATQAAELNQEVIFDMRNLIASRLRAEAGSQMASGHASAQHVRLDVWGSARNADNAKQVSTAMAPMREKMTQAAARADLLADDAADAAKEAKVILKEAREMRKNVVAETHDLAVAEVKRQAASAVKREAEAQAILNGWDKPVGWGKVLGARAAEPYLRQMVDAVTRVDEYTSFSKGLINQAKAAQAQAAALVPHANAMQAHNDKLGMATERKKIRDLIAKSRSLDSEAHKYWNIADAARKTIPEWQDAAAKASARTSWEWDLALTTPAP